MRENIVENVRQSSLRRMTLRERFSLLRLCTTGSFLTRQFLVRNRVLQLMNRIPDAWYVICNIG